MQKLFGNRTDESLYLEIRDYADEQHGSQKTMNEYFHRAGEIGDAMEEERHIDLVCSSMRFHAHAELMANLDNDYFLITHNEDFDEA